LFSGEDTEPEACHLFTGLAARLNAPEPDQIIFRVRLNEHGIKLILSK